MAQIRSLHGGSATDIVYFERQGQDRLCGLHCLNNLMQGRFYRVEDVAAIGVRLDAEERRLMGGSYDGSYTNVSNDGFFSVSVIEQSLAQRGFKMIPFGNPSVADLRVEPTRFNDAFICNLREHWFAVRSVKGRYFRLDSLRRAPEAVSAVNLRPFLDSLRGSSYSVFVIRNQDWPHANLPEPCPEDFNQTVIQQASEPVLGGAYYSFNVVSRLQDTEQETESASRSQPRNTKEGRPTEGHEWPAGKGQFLNSDLPTQNIAAISPDVDAETLQVLLQSALEFRQTLPDPIPDDGTGTWIKLVDSRGTQYKRRFPVAAAMADIFKWIHKSDDIMPTAVPALAAREELVLQAQFPKRCYIRRFERGEMRITLDGEDITNKAVAAELPSGESLRLQICGN